MDGLYGTEEGVNRAFRGGHFGKRVRSNWHCGCGDRESTRKHGVILVVVLFDIGASVY